MLLHIEWDDARDEPRLKKYYQYNLEKNRPWWQKKIDEGIVKSAQGWGDGTGHIVHLTEFEDTEAFAKFWADEKFHYLMLGFFPLVDNMKLRIFRPGMRPKS